MKISILYLFLTGFVFSNCEGSKKVTDNTDAQPKEVTMNADENEKLEKLTEGLIGSWEWIRTDCCGRTSKTTYASPEAEKRIIAFYEDGTALFYTIDPDGAMTKQKYTKGMMGNQATVKIGPLQPAIMEISDDTLMLNWGYFDLQIEYYKRVITK
jgi:hypothetical protein